MKLWLLRPREDLPTDNNPWEPWYDKAFGFVIRAKTEEEARHMAAGEGGDENRTSEFAPRQPSPWNDPALSTCVELKGDGVPGVILQDFASA